MDMVQFTLKGTLPLLMHNVASMMTSDEGRILPPEEAAEKAAYRLPDGSLCFPAAGVRNAMLKAMMGAKAIEEKTRQKKSATALLSAAVLLADDWFPFVDVDNNALRDYRIDIRSVMIRGRGRIPRARPRLEPPWYLVGCFMFRSDTVAEVLVHQALELAGRTVGIGDFRLEKKGPFGAFEVATLKVVEGRD